ncbi:MAG TPA: helix-turn-helix domain-containing protein [Bacteroidales bacterium]|jgi:AraC-like DNA-binding protein|nr:helix-turn-helix domain-containing protein [Bacteroidales bacterium]
MHFEARLDIFALFMLLGISQGIFLIYYYLSKSKRQDRTNLYFGLFLISCIILNSEILLNYSGLIVKVISVENYSEPFIFLPMPFIYMLVKARLNEKYTREDYVHFFPFVFYFLYCFLYFLQSPEFKYNSYVYCYKPDWAVLSVDMRLPEDPLGLRKSLAPLYISQALVYLYLIFFKMKYALAEGKFAFFGRKDKKSALIFTIWIHTVVAVALVIFIKINFERDLGDYLIGTYISVLLYINGFLVVSRQITPHHEAVREDSLKPKYEKSPLSEEKKSEILNKITVLLEQKKYFSKNTLSLAELAKAVSEPPHYVSQVINEKLDKNFFDLLSGYRISEAKKLLHEKAGEQMTIEDIAEKVGYNSKAAFNKAFKTITGVTPSEFRKNR